jgi:hypothetical protein
MAYDQRVKSHQLPATDSPAVSPCFTSECPSSELNRRCFETGQNKIGMYYDVFYFIDFCNTVH